MKKIKLLLGTLLVGISTLLVAQPQAVSYQAIIRDGSGNVLQNQNIVLQIDILQNSQSGTVVYSETHTVTTNSYGLVNVNIGEGTPNTGSFDAIDWAAGPYFLKTSVDLLDGNGLQELGTQQMVSVPYALYTAKADSAIWADTALFASGTSAAGNNGEVQFNHNGQLDASPSLYWDITKERLGIGTNTPQGRVVIQQDPDAPDSLPLFEVKDKNGDPVFVVYPDSVHVFLSEDSAKSSSAHCVSHFAVSGRVSQKGTSQPYLQVTQGCTHISFEEDNNNSPESGFAVSGRVTTKSGTENQYFSISPDDTAIVINDEPKVTWYPNKNAFWAGQLVVNSPYDVGTNSLAVGYHPKAQGEYSQALGYNSSSLGNYSTAIGNNATAMGPSSFALGDSAYADDSASYAIGLKARATGFKSLAIGSGGIAYNTNGQVWTQSEASGNYSVAIGNGCIASGPFSFAIGILDTCEGYYSMAFGYGTHSSGYNSTTLGNYTKASGSNALAIGSYCEAHGASSFAAGYNSIVAATASNATAIGYQSAALESFSFALGFMDTTTGWGAYALGYQSKAEGNTSFALGANVRATGISATAMGNQTIASGQTSFALGNRTTASGDYSFSSGYLSTASGNSSATFGSTTEATGNNSIAIGYHTDAIGDQALAGGLFTSASGTNSVALGYYSNAEGDYSFAIGRSYAKGNYSFSAGYYTKSKSYLSFVVGKNNDTSFVSSTDSWVDTDPLFVVGNGQYTPHNAMVVLKNGNVGINTNTPDKLLTVNGDARVTGDIYYGASGSGTTYNKPDFVFMPSYDKKFSINAIEKYINRHGHLPWVTAAKDEKNGINLTRMSFETLESVENLQLQVIELNKHNLQLQKENENLKKMIHKMNKRLNELEKEIKRIK